MVRNEPEYERAFFVEHTRVRNAGYVRIVAASGELLHIIGFCKDFETADGFLAEVVHDQGFNVNRLEHQ